MNKDKVYLKGYVLGHAADTLGYQGLLVQLENLDVVEIDKDLVHKEVDEPQLIKLKDIIARIKGFDSGTRKVWLDGILGELGSEYGSLKYKQGYDQGKFEGSLIPYEEPQKPVVSQFVADWYEEYKDDLEISIFHYVNNINKEDESAFKRWFVDSTTKPFQILVNMHQFGYDIEKEKRYTVKMKNLRALFCYLAYIPDEGYWSLMASGGKSIVIKHTRKQLEEAGFGWVFDCEGMEVEEVE